MLPLPGLITVPPVAVDTTGVAPASAPTSGAPAGGQANSFRSGASKKSSTFADDLQRAMANPAAPVATTPPPTPTPSSPPAGSTGSQGGTPSAAAGVGQTPQQPESTPAASPGSPASPTAPSNTAAPTPDFLQAVLAAQTTTPIAAGQSTAVPNVPAANTAPANPATPTPPATATALPNRPLGPNPPVSALTAAELSSGQAVGGDERHGPIVPNAGGSLLPGGNSLGQVPVLQGSGASGSRSLAQVLVEAGSTPPSTGSGADGPGALAPVQVLIEPIGPSAADLVKNTDKSGQSDRDEFSKRKDPSITSGPDAVTNRGAAGNKPPLATADSPKPETPVVDTVASSIIAHAQLAQRDGTTEFHLRLEPPELGSVHIHLTATDQGISARLFVHEPGARQLIQSQLESLRQRLQQEGLTLGRFDVAGQGGGSSGQGQSQGRPYAGPRLAGGDPAKLRPATAGAARSWTVQTVDVVV